jgi:hypothetical protein
VVGDGVIALPGLQVLGIGISNGLVAGEPMPVRRAWSWRNGLELAERAPGLLLWPDSTGTRRFAWSSFGLDVRVDPGAVDIEPTCGAVPPWLPLAAQPGARLF